MGWISVARLALAAAMLYVPIVNAAEDSAPAGDPEAGRAQAVTCGACHGQDGAVPIDPTYPALAGQNERYTFRQLQLIQTNERPVPLMTGQLDGKSEQDLLDLAAYYASLPEQGGVAEADEEVLELAESIYRGGILEKGVAACTSCHSPRGDGNAPAGFPAIAGQPVGYTVAQLTAYREGERDSDELFGGMMRNIAGKLTDREINALAQYLRGLQ